MRAKAVLLIVGAAAFVVACDPAPEPRMVYATPHDFAADLTGLQALWARQVEQRLAAGIPVDHADLPTDVTPSASVDSATGRWRGTVNPPPSQALRGGPHTYNLRLQSNDDVDLNAVQVAVAGGMPLHSHGLPTKPTLTQTEPGAYELRGLVFSMPGWWQLAVGVTDADSGAVDLLLFDFFVPP